MRITDTLLGENVVLGSKGAYVYCFQFQLIQEIHEEDMIKCVELAVKMNIVQLHSA